ncbi:MAG: hypothetical protein ABSD29_02805 [Verrucomicrobiota bacterium]|jgi:hypothetical protein
MKKTPKITLLRADNQHREVVWPYDHIPRVGDRFCFERGIAHVVTLVTFNAIEGSDDFMAVVVVDRYSDRN